MSAADLDILLALGGATGGFEDGARIGIHPGLANFTYSSIIADPNGGANSLALLKTGGNTLTLDQANTYSGGTTLEKGVLWFEDDNALGTGDILITDEGTDPVLEFGADGLNLTNDIVVSDTGGLKLIRASLTSGNNAMELSGDMVVNESTLGDFRFRVNNPGSAVNVMTMSGPISGSGSIGKSGWGKLIMAADNSYSGGTKIIDGMMQLGANGDTGNIVGDVEFQGGSGADELRFARSNDFVFAGNISGDGKVSTVGNEVDETTGTEEGDAGKFNSEFLILTGSNTYTGGTTVNRETRLLAIGPDALGSGDVKLVGQDAGLILSNGVTLANHVSVIDDNRVHVGVTASGSATLTGDISIDNNSVWDFHLRPDSGETLTVSGAIQDDGGDGFFTKSSTGTLILEGDNTYSGDARIDGGSAYFNGDSSAATGDINAYNSAVLGGSGTIGAAVETYGSSTLTGTLTFTNTVTVFSNLKPGTSTGTLTFNNTLALGSASTTTLEIESLASFDKLANDGGDTISFDIGATVAFDASAYTANDGDTFQVLDNWGGYSGNLANLNFTGTNLTGGAYIDVSTLLTDGKVTIVGSGTTPATLYADWATLYGLTGANNGLGDNPDGDAFDNLAEYALGGDPTNKNDTGIAPILWLGADGGSNWFYYAHAQRSDSDDRDLTYTVKQDTDLPTATWAGSVDLLGTNVTGGAFDSVTNRVPSDTESEQFLQLQISTDL